MYTVYMFEGVQSKYFSILFIFGTEAPLLVNTSARLYSYREDMKAYIFIDRLQI